jgi:hypothetical protein
MGQIEPFTKIFLLQLYADMKYFASITYLYRNHHENSHIMSLVH